jgi:putative transcriptional regulator
MKSKTIISRFDRDGRLMRKTESGWVEVKIEPLPPVPVDFEPAFDPENPPLTEERLKHMKRVPRTVSMRRALMLTQEEFADRYEIPIGTLRDWEEKRTEPDAVARAYLFVIASDPDGTAKALRKRKEWRAKSGMLAREREEAH